MEALSRQAYATPQRDKGSPRQATSPTGTHTIGEKEEEGEEEEKKKKKTTTTKKKHVVVALLQQLSLIRGASVREREFRERTKREERVISGTRFFRFCILSLKFSPKIQTSTV
jgi:hypothetical protein